MAHVHYRIGNWNNPNFRLTMEQKKNFIWWLELARAIIAALAGILGGSVM